MFPKWDSDADDPAAENIIKVMFNRRPWKWTMDCWEVTGTWVNTKPARKEIVVVNEDSTRPQIAVVNEDSPRPQKRARKEDSVEAPVNSSEEVPTEARLMGMSKEDIERLFKDVVDAMREGFGTLTKEVKSLSERVEAVEKKMEDVGKKVESVEKKVEAVGKVESVEKKVEPSPAKQSHEPGSESVNGANSGRKSLDKALGVSADASSSKEMSLVKEDEAPESSLVMLAKDKPTASDKEKEDARYKEKRDAALAICRSKSDRVRKPAASQQSPYTAKVIIPKKKSCPGYNPFPPLDRNKLKQLADWLKTDPHYRTPVEKKPLTSPTRFYNTLRKDLSWLDDAQIDAWINVLRKRYDANPQLFRSERMCFLDHLFSQQWRFNYHAFKESVPDHNGLGRRLPGGAWHYYNGSLPSFCQSNKIWGKDIDDIYAPVNHADAHWIAMWISIPKRHIVVWDSIATCISPEELDQIMEPFLHMVPYVMVECSSADGQYTLEPYTYSRENVPQARSGDCGVYALKYIECHALGMPFNQKDFAKANGKAMRDKMAVDIFEELPGEHERVNHDGDTFLETYDGVV